MKYLATLVLLLLVTSLGCTEKQTAPVTTPDELSQYETPSGEMDKAAAEASKAAQPGN